MKETETVENGSVVELKDEEAKFVGREDDKMSVDRTRINEVGISDDVRGFEPGRGGRRVREAGHIRTTIHGDAERLKGKGRGVRQIRRHLVTGSMGKWRREEKKAKERQNGKWKTKWQMEDKLAEEREENREGKKGKWSTTI